MSGVVDLMEATVRLEQPLASGQSVLGSGFMISAPGRDRTPRTILVTAHHVLARMPADKAKLGLRATNTAGEWRYAPVKVRIRDADGDPLWTRHPTQDVAVLELPGWLTIETVPIAELPGSEALQTLQVEPGDEMMVLGFPRGFAANPAGFPILRSGKVASFPLSPAQTFPTYLLDFSVFAGNSGGPVYLTRHRYATTPTEAVITGVLTQQLIVDGDRLEIGNVTQADYINETISLLDSGSATEISPDSGTLPFTDPVPSGQGAEVTPLRMAWDALLEDLDILRRRIWISVRDFFRQQFRPDPKRTTPTS